MDPALLTDRAWGSYSASESEPSVLARLPVEFRLVDLGFLEDVLFSDTSITFNISTLSGPVRDYKTGMSSAMYLRGSSGYRARSVLPWRHAKRRVRVVSGVVNKTLSSLHDNGRFLNEDS